jgi:hypothetical protein
MRSARLRVLVFASCVLFQTNEQSHIIHCVQLLLRSPHVLPWIVTERLSNIPNGKFFDIKTQWASRANALFSHCSLVFEFRQE